MPYRCWCSPPQNHLISKKTRDAIGFSEISVLIEVTYHIANIGRGVNVIPKNRGGKYWYRKKQEHEK